MINIIKEQFLNKQTQVIIINKDGLVTETENTLFHIEKQTQIQDFHPFFEVGIVDLIKKPNYSETFYFIHIQSPEKDGCYDVYINSGNNIHPPFVLLFDLTERYNTFQNVAQQKNLSVLNFRTEELKNQKLKIEKDFKNKFLATVSHDLRTPIASMLGFIEIFQELKITKEQSDILKIISNTGNHLNELVEDLVDISNIEAGKFTFKDKSFDFYEFTNQIEKTYFIKTAHKNLDFSILIDKKIPRTLIADQTRLFQLITNVLDNAVKFTDKGNITISIKENYRRADTIGIQIQVIDTGIGFSTKNKSKAFESFTKLHNDDFAGLGLGLSIVHEIVVRMSGTIKIKSVVKQGTTIEINIPLKINLMSSAKTKKASIKEFLSSDFRKKYKVLVVDDNETNQMLLLKILSDHGGFFVDITNSAEQAVALAQTELYDLILMDAKMPESNGIETLKTIRSNPNVKIATTPIIILSANTTASEKAEFREFSIKNIVQRPHTREALFLNIYKVLRIKKDF